VGLIFHWPIGSDSASVLKRKASVIALPRARKARILGRQRDEKARPGFVELCFFSFSRSFCLRISNIFSKMFKNRKRGAKVLYNIFSMNLEAELYWRNVNLLM
jgi:hypothetical protein